MEAFARTAQWGGQHRPEVAALLSNATGMPPEVMQRAIGRLPFQVLPMSDGLVQSQQAIADRFRALSILPVQIKVADAVWHANA
jgi:sulfonate transport system substrate-binding protein